MRTLLVRLLRLSHAGSNPRHAHPERGTSAHPEPATAVPWQSRRTVSWQSRRTRSSLVIPVFPKQDRRTVSRHLTDPGGASPASLRIMLCIALFAAGCDRSARNNGQAPSAAQPTLRFEDVTSKSGITFSRENGAFGKKWMPETMGGGGAFLDYDNDGFLDILLVNGDWWEGHGKSGIRPTLALYRNIGDGKFEDVTQRTGLNVSIQGMGAAVGDYDNDGWPDLYVTGVGGNRLFHNETADGGGAKRRVFRDVTEQSGTKDTGWSTSAAWLDFDSDGKLDLFVCHYVKWTPATDLFCGTTEKLYCRPQEYQGESCKLFRNVGGGKFTDVTKAAGLVNPHSKALGVCILDLDDDGQPDILVANDMEPNSVYHNLGNGKFKEIGLELGIAVDDNGKTRAGMGIDAVDGGSAGRQFVAIGNFAFEGMALYTLNGIQSAVERSRPGGVYDASYPWVTFGLVFSDFDNDGRPDILAANGHVEDDVQRRNPGQSHAQPMLLFQGTADGVFTSCAKQAGNEAMAPMVGRGVCRGDFDNDGRVDALVISNNGPPRLLRNTSDKPGHWLSIRLVGSKSNRDGLGAMVMVDAGGKKSRHYARNGSSYLSASDPRMHVGLGGAQKVESITVRWPSGVVEKFDAGGVDRTVMLTEGTGIR